MDRYEFAGLCAHASAEEVRYALKSGADMNENALITATRLNSDAEVLRVLLDEAKRRGIDIVNKRAPIDEVTALYLAAKRNRLDFVKILLDAGADPNMFVVLDNKPVDAASDVTIKDFIADHMDIVPYDMNKLARYMYGHKAFPLAFKWAMRAAENGIDESQYYVGRMYENAEGVSQDFEQAAMWYRKAAEQNYSLAQFHLGRLYYRNQNYKEAIEWLTKASEQEVIPAQILLADMYYDGLGVEQSYSEALNLYKKAQSKSDSTNAEVRNKIGFMYEEGKGVTQDYHEALNWYAFSNNEEAMANFERIMRSLAEDAEKNAKKISDIDLSFFVTGDSSNSWHAQGITTNHTLAYSLLKKAAENGHSPSQCFMALIPLWELSRGGEKTRIASSAFMGPREAQEEFQSWYAKAAAQNNGLAKRIPDLIEAERVYMEKEKARGFAAEIAGDKVNVRANPGTSAKVVAQLNTGDQVRIIDGRGQWAHIKTESGIDGWVFEKYIHIKGVITSDKVDVRADHSSSAKVIKQLNAGHPVTLLEATSGWLRIRTASGTEGWVSDKFVEPQR